MSQQYSLRWNNHQPNFISMFTSLLSTQTLVDVTLAAEGKQLQAHKVVLSACSTYFHALFVDNPSRHPIVILKDVSFADLRTMVDFMYYGVVNVTEEQLPQVLDTAKLLKIKGLTEMPDSTSLTRSQGTSADFQTPGDTNDPLKLSNSPATSPSSKKKRRRKSSTGSTSLNMDENRTDDGHSVDLVRAESITLSSMPQQRRARMFQDQDERIDNTQHAPETHNLNVEPLGMDATNSAGMPQGGQWSTMEHMYPRYSNACIGGAMQQEGLYMNNVVGGEQELAEYGQALAGGACVAEPPPPLEAPPAPPKRRRTTNPQSEENFQRALEAVRFGGIGFCKAARMFGVNNRTLWLEYKKKGYPNNRPSIKSRIKREHTTPPPELKEEAPPPQQQMALLCPPHPMPVSFIDSRPIDFPLQEGLSTQAGLKVRRAKLFKRQSRVQPEEREVRKQASEPAPASSCAAPTLQKHESYPQYQDKSQRPRQHQEVLLIRAVTVVDRQPSSESTSDVQHVRASHTPAVRAGPPLSCNFCWNTVDDAGRILRRKTQYHCPECRKNLCIVPCFHEYHEADPESDSNAR